MAVYDFITTTGTVVPDAGDLLTTVEGEFREVFGEGLSLDPQTPQGVLIAAEVSARAQVARNNADLANQINPNLSEGVFLDAVMAMTGSRRTAATRSTVVAQLAGVPSTIIAAGSRAQTADREVFELLSPVVLNIAGAGEGTFRAVNYGPVSVAVGALAEIVDGVLGWESVTNADPATLGADVMSDQAAREFRRRTLGLQAQRLAVAITSALYAVEGVLSLSFRENTTDVAATIDGVLMAPHSVFACVDGGSDLDVATALLEKKSGGCDWNGTTSVDVLEPASGQTYPVLFYRPAEIDVLVRVTVKNIAALTDPVSLVKTAVVNYAEGRQLGEPGFVVGASVTTFELGGAVSREAPGLRVLLVEISTDGIDWTPVEVPVGLLEVARTSSSAVTVILT